MSRHSRLPAALLALASVLGGCQRSPDAGAGPAATATSTRHDTSADHGTAAGLEWTELVTGGAGPNDRLPMIVGMHGLGDSPARFGELYGSFPGRARVVLLRGITPWHGGFAWWVPTRDDTITSAHTADGIANAADQVAAAITEIESQKPTMGKPIVTGFSQGGALSFAVAIRHPALVSSAYPMSGWLPASLRVSNAALTASGLPPILAFHGSDDDRVPLHESEETVAGLAALGFHAELRTLPGVAHSVSSPERNELYQHLEADITALGR